MVIHHGIQDFVKGFWVCKFVVLLSFLLNVGWWDTTQSDAVSTCNISFAFLFGCLHRGLIVAVFKRTSAALHWSLIFTSKLSFLKTIYQYSASEEPLLHQTEHEGSALGWATMSLSFEVSMFEAAATLDKMSHAESNSLNDLEIMKKYYICITFEKNGKLTVNFTNNNWSITDN